MFPYFGFTVKIRLKRKKRGAEAWIKVMSVQIHVDISDPVQLRSVLYSTLSQHAQGVHAKSIAACAQAVQQANHIVRIGVAKKRINRFVFFLVLSLLFF